ncbi:Myb domain protein 62, partial [Tanacetum coccineum]
GMENPSHKKLKQVSGKRQYQGVENPSHKKQKHMSGKTKRFDSSQMEMGGPGKGAFTRYDHQKKPSSKPSSSKPVSSMPSRFPNMAFVWARTHYNSSHVSFHPFPVPENSDFDFKCTWMRFASEDFQKISEKNKKNRSKNLVPPTVGTRSLARRVDESRREGKEVSEIEQYKMAHYSKKLKGMINEEADTIWNDLQAEEATSSCTSAEICLKKLGHLPGHIKGRSASTRNLGNWAAPDAFSHCLVGNGDAGGILVLDQIMDPNRSFILSTSFPSHVSEVFPNASLNFAGDASMVLKPENYLLKQKTVGDDFAWWHRVSEE